MIAIVLLAALLFCCIISLVLCRNDTKGYRPRYKRGQEPPSPYGVRYRSPVQSNNPLLNRPPNPDLDIIYNKRFECSERLQEGKQAKEYI